MELNRTEPKRSHPIAAIGQRARAADVPLTSPVYIMRRAHLDSFGVGLFRSNACVRRRMGFVSDFCVLVRTFGRAHPPTLSWTATILRACIRSQRERERPNWVKLSLGHKRKFRRPQESHVCRRERTEPNRTGHRLRQPPTLARQLPGRRAAGSLTIGGHLCHSSIRSRDVEPNVTNKRTRRLRRKLCVTQFGPRNKPIQLNALAQRFHIHRRAHVSVETLLRPLSDWRARGPVPFGRLYLRSAAQVPEPNRTQNHRRNH